MKSWMVGVLFIFIALLFVGTVQGLSSTREHVQGPPEKIAEGYCACPPVTGKICWGCKGKTEDICLRQYCHFVPPKSALKCDNDADDEDLSLMDCVWVSPEKENTSNSLSYLAK